jgi:hypothetical protein
LPRAPTNLISRYAVIDDFLLKAESTGIWDYLCSADFSPLHDKGWEPIFRFGNSEILVGEDFQFNARGKPKGKRAVPKCLRVLAHKLLTDARCSWFLSTCAGWKIFVLCPYIYPVGTALRWHTDTDKVAACSYYAHPQWHPNWGGELLVDTSTLAPMAERDSQRLYYGLDAAPVLRSTEGRFVSPTPNRLSFIRGGAAHSINRVDMAAGEACRVSVNGFFY